MEPQVDTLVRNAIQPLVTRIDQLEAENKELRARLDNFQATQNRLPKPSGHKQPVAPKTVAVKDIKKPQDKPGPSNNGSRPSLPLDKKPKEEEPKPKPERPSIGKPGDKKPIENGPKHPIEAIPKPAVKTELPKKDEHKKDETKPEQYKTEEHKKDDHKKDVKPVVNPKSSTKDITKKDVKSPAKELKPPEQPKPGQKSPSSGTDKYLHNKLSGGKLANKQQNEKLEKYDELATKEKNQSKHEQKDEHKVEQKHEEIKQQPKLVAEEPHPTVPAPQHEQPSANPEPVASHQEKIVVDEKSPQQVPKEEPKNEEQVI